MQNKEEDAQKMRMKLIRQSLPFTRLSHERLMDLAKNVKEIIVPAGTLLFKKGQEGKACYLIGRGEVEIFDEHQLAILKTPALFGEATLITDAPRNASARTLTECQLFMIENAYLSELIASENDVAKIFMTLMVDRSMPLKNPLITAHHRKTSDGQPIIILKNAATHSYFKLSEEGYFLWEKMDGKHTMRDLTMAYAEKFDVFVPELIAAIISKLAQSDFVLNVVTEHKSAEVVQPLWVRWSQKLRKIVEMRVAIGNADKWITSIYNKGFYLLFSRIGALFVAAFGITGLFAFVFAIPSAIHLFASIKNSWLFFFLLIPFALVSTTCHELGHALATKSYGHDVHFMGVGWYWVGPVAFTDTSDMWLDTRLPRIIVNLAGIFSDLMLAGFVSILFFVVTNIYVQAFLWLFAGWIYLNIIRHLSPLQELDGYYVMMDLFDRPRLRQHAVNWLLKQFPQLFKKQNVTKGYFPEVMYWITCLCFIMLLSVITFLVQSFIFNVLHFKPGNIFVALTLPILVAVISTLSIVADIRQQEHG